MTTTKETEQRLEKNMAHTIKASDCDTNSIATVHGIIQYARVMNTYTDEEIDE